MPKRTSYLLRRILNCSHMMPQVGWQLRCVRRVCICRPLPPGPWPLPLVSWDSVPAGAASAEGAGLDLEIVSSANCPTGGPYGIRSSDPDGGVEPRSKRPLNRCSCGGAGGARGLLLQRLMGIDSLSPWGVLSVNKLIIVVTIEL